MPVATITQFMLPRWVVVRIALLVGRLAWHLNRRQRERLLQNLRHVLGPAADEAAIRRHGRQAFANFAVNYADLLRIPVLRKRLAGIGDFEPVVLDRVMAQGRGYVLVTAHLGNWDLAGAFLAARGYPISAVVEPIPRGWTRTFNRYRSATNLEAIPIPERERTARALERRRLLALVADRDLTGRGLACPAFDAVRSFPRGPAVYALRYGVPVVLGYCVFQHRPGRPPYLGVVEPPFEFSPSGDMTADIDDLTRIIAERLNRLIAEYPDQWLVFKAGWQ
jgi:KDO2-lipid IV(A) lauroyltransferase